MQKIIMILAICFCSIHTYAQDNQGIKFTKEVICKGAAISVVSHVQPFFDRNFPKSEILEMTNDLVKDPIKDAPDKAYELFKANKTKDEVIAILYNDFMKLDEETVSKFLINHDSEDY